MKTKIRCCLSLFLLNFLVISSLYAGSITNVTLVLTPDNEVGTDTNFQLDFDIENDLPSKGKIKIELESAAGLDCSAANGFFRNMSGVGGLITEWASADVLVFVRDGTAGAIAGGTRVSMEFGLVRLPDNAGTYLIKRLETRKADVNGGNTIDFADDCATYEVVTKPTASILSVSPNPAIVGETVTVEATATDQENDHVQLKIDWGDSGTRVDSAMQASGSTFIFTHSYSTDGTFDIRVLPKDEHGNEGDWSAAETITVNQNSAPETDIQSVSPNPATTGETVTLKVKATDTNGDQVQVKVDWRDGTVSAYSNLEPNGSTFTFSHVYSTQNDYMVRTRGKDHRGLEGGWTDSLKVTVEKPNTAPRVTITDITPSSATVGELVTIQAQAVDDDNDQVQTRINWGDGEISPFTDLSPQGTIFTYEHYYAAAGDYYISVVAQDEHGLRGLWSTKELMHIAVNQPLITNIDDFDFYRTEPFILELDTCLMESGYPPESFSWQIIPNDTALQFEFVGDTVIFFTKTWFDTTGVQFKVSHPTGMMDSITVLAQMKPDTVENSLHIVTYNLSGFPGIDYAARIPEFRIVVQALLPDLLVVQQMKSQDGVNIFLDEVLNYQRPDEFAAATFSENEGENALFYRVSKFEFNTMRQIISSFKDIGEYRLRTKVNLNLPEIFVYSAEFEQGSSTAARQSRLETAATLRSELNQLPANTTFFVGGNLNFQDGTDAPFQELVGGQTENSGQCFDPINSIANWHNNPLFARQHTHSTRITVAGSDTTGGLLDRYDFILFSEALTLPDDFVYLDSSYKTFGNDGQHFGQAVNAGLNWIVAPFIADALPAASEHLPALLAVTMNPTNQPPYITSAGQVNAYEKVLFQYTATAYDPAGDVINYTFENYPNWLTPVNDTISGTPAEGTPDTSFTVIASDGEFSDTLQVTITVYLKNDPPVLTSPDSVVAYENNPFEYIAQAIDPENAALSFQFQNYPHWLSPQDTILTGTPGAAAQDTSFTVIASDGENADTMQVTVTVILENRPPEFSSASSVSVFEDSLLEYTAQAVDPEGKALSYVFQDYPVWLTPAWTKISGVPPKDAADSSFVVIASDGELSDTLKVRISILRINLAPKLTSPDSAWIYEDALFEYTARAVDPENQPITFAFQNYPTWLTALDSTISGRPTEGRLDTSFLVIASDGIWHDSLQVFVNITPVNDAPQIVDLADFSMNHSEVYIMNLTKYATDPDDPPTSLSWEISAANPNLKITLNNQIAQFTAGGWVDTTQVKFIVTDSAGAADSLTIQVVVKHPEGIDNDENKIPDDFYLGQNYPNPFNLGTVISYGLPRETLMNIVVFDLNGRAIDNLWNGKQNAGHYTIKWNATQFPSGVYFIRMQTSAFIETRKCILIK